MNPSYRYFSRIDDTKPCTFVCDVRRETKHEANGYVVAKIDATPRLISSIQYGCSFELGHFPNYRNGKSDIVCCEYLTVTAVFNILTLPCSNASFRAVHNIHGSGKCG